MQYRLLNQSNYEPRRRDLINLLEGTLYRPYLDGDGWITIGLGFNLGQPNNTANRTDFLQTYLGLVPGNPAYTALDNFLAAKHLAMKTQANDGVAPQGQNPETPANDPLMIQLNQLLSAAYQANPPNSNAAHTFAFIACGCA